MKRNRDSVVNLFDVNLDLEMEEILSLGMNCHRKRKFDQNERNELIYEHIRKKQRSSLITVWEEQNFKCKLERFGTKHIIDNTQNILGKDQYKKIETIPNNPHNAIRKLDKGNVFVLLNSQYYNDGKEELVPDKSKFNKIDQDTTEKLTKR